MLQKLRRKFILLNMICVTVVVTIAFCAIMALNYQQSITLVYEDLNSAVTSAQNCHDRDLNSWRNSFFDDALGGASASSNSAIASDGADASTSGDFGSSASSEETYAPPKIGGRNTAASLTPLAVYTIYADGHAELEPQITTASLSDDVLASALAKLPSMAEGGGSLEDLGLYYNKRTVGEIIIIAFADEGSVTNGKNMAPILLLSGIGVLAVFFVISLFFSRWALRPVEESWTKQRQFVADASHELKTPLTVILANTSIMMKHRTNTIADEQQWLESTQQEAVGMQELVTNMLDLARMDAEQATASSMGSANGIPQEPLDLTELTEGAILQFESVAFERHVLIQDQLEEGIRTRGQADKLQRLVTILLDNACKYCPEGDTVTATLKREGRNAKLSVHNGGNPIPPDALPHVFDRFYRADEARTGGSNSYGLGLAIAQEIAQSHKGDIAVASSEAAGTTFTVTLPIA